MEMHYLFSMPGDTRLIQLFLLLAFVVPGILYLVTLNSTLKLVSPENRKMSPGKIWLLLIPIFGNIWHFLVVINMSDSIKTEAVSKSIRIDESRPAFNIGIVMCVAGCLVFIPSIRLLASFVVLVSWIIYWVKISGYKKRLQVNA